MNYKHGLRDTPEYMAWSHMKNRCYNKNDSNYENYGGRGIKVCDRWLESFENFIEDIGRKPYKEYTLERVNVNGNYEPSNCTWADRQRQAWNRRTPRTNTSGARGVARNKRKDGWVAYIYNKRQRYHLGSFKNFDDAVEARKAAESAYAR